ncbi:MAG: hypothetical protein Unbinned6805contig1000_31 [Prokaryotic dsDNA virus sp.]|nr:MAG: hypothetical protein Unbinned6805contig1000_31 [Prokaryotic dsDNA virus sp.]|tara:strand:- start:33181 stop:34029 length:849 start_codon:yes stop_codon:yes gene_type:complete
MNLSEMKSRLESFNKDPYIGDGLVSYIELFTLVEEKRSLNSGCFHSLLYDSPIRKKSKAIAVSVKNNKRHCTREMLYDWFKFLMREHPLSHLFYKTSAKWAIENGLIVRTGSHPSNQVGHALKTIRLAWEHPILLETWHKLVSSGMNKRAAFAFAGAYYESEGYLYPISYVYSHNIYDNLDDCKRMLVPLLTGDMISGEPYNKLCRYEGSLEVFNTDSDNSEMETLLMKSLDSKDDKPKVIGINPFTKENIYTKKGNEGFSIERLVPVVNRYVEELHESLHS